jgi:hypothetical protein
MNVRIFYNFFITRLFFSFSYRHHRSDGATCRVPLMHFGCLGSISAKPELFSLVILGSLFTVFETLNMMVMLRLNPNLKEQVILITG